MSKLLIKNGRYINPKNNVNDLLDVFIEDGKIKEVKKDLNYTNVEIIDATNCWVCPGLIDIHSHLRDPGNPEKETIATGTRSASAGGFTSVCAMANTNPTIDCAALVEYVTRVNKETGIINVFQIGSVSKGLKGEELSPMAELKASGAIAFSDDGKPVENLSLLRKALEYAKMLDMNIISHAETSSLCGCGAVNEGEWSLKLGIPGIPSASESVCVARELEVVRLTKGKLHFAHLSTKRGTELVRAARKEGLNVTAEVTPHHLVLTDEAIQHFDTNAKMNPPLRTQEDIDELISGVLDGTIEVFATDHAPHSYEEKSRSMVEAPFGIIGFETALPIYLEVFYHSKRLNEILFIEKLTTNPARILNIPRGSISIGEVADITIIDPNYEWTYDVNKSKSKSRNSPFHDKKLKGKSLYTIVNGKVVFNSKQDLSLVS